MLSPAPCGLVVQGQEHECPLPEYSKVEGPVKSGLTLKKAEEKNAQIWVVAGSSYFRAGRAKTGCGAVTVNTSQERKAPVKPYKLRSGGGTEGVPGGGSGSPPGNIYLFGLGVQSHSGAAAHLGREGYVPRRRKARSSCTVVGATGGFKKG